MKAPQWLEEFVNSALGCVHGDLSPQGFGWRLHEHDDGTWIAHAWPESVMHNGERTHADFRVCVFSLANLFDVDELEIHADPDGIDFEGDTEGGETVVLRITYKAPNEVAPRWEYHEQSKSVRLRLELLHA